MNYTREQTLTKIAEVMVYLFEIDSSDVTENARLYEDLDIDSIDAVDLMIELRPFTGKTFSPEDFKEVRTVGDILNVVEAQ